ncbi:MAG: PDZ domain-containing protein [Planctomycetota bacterium]|nr:MAG: PDZ domain-containing protein [Planctomycetota bacterium]RLS95861.1 MAG: PDZ domain-containing protein [Planctomycetota bacterium]
MSCNRRRARANESSPRIGCNREYAVASTPTKLCHRMRTNAMSNFTHVGPGLVVLAAASLALIAAPLCIRRANDAQADANIAFASQVLARPTVMASVRSSDATSTRVALAAPPSNEVESGLTLLEQFNRANRAIAKLVEPSVVHVSTLVAESGAQGGAPMGAYGSSGSGWIWDEDGHIVTNAHVVEGAERLQVQMFDGELRPAELVGLDLRTDIAVIKVASGGMRASLRGDSGKLEQGDLVYAFGSPFDFRFSMSSGIVSGLGRSAGLADVDYENFIQTDAAINPGNSGGPLTDIRGRVIGMNTAIATGRGNTVGQGQFAGIGLAIPMSMIESVVSQLIETGEVRKGFLGVTVVSLDQARFNAQAFPNFAPAAAHFKGDGAVVGAVSAGSPADKSGFREGDVIVSIDGQKIVGETAVPAIVSSRRPGDEVRFELWRGSSDGVGAQVEIVTKLGQLDMGMRVAFDVPAILARAGIVSFATATSERASKLSVPFRRGVIIESLQEGSELSGMLSAGAAITGVFDQNVGSVDELYARLARVFPAGGRFRRSEFPLTVTQPDGSVVAILISLRR